MSSDPDSFDPTPSAAFWFARMSKGSPSREDEQAFRIWLASDPANVRAYRAHQLQWAELGVVADAAPILALRSKALREASRASDRSARLLVRTAALVAVLGLTAGLFTWATWNPAATYTTGPGERLTATLSDRTEVTLAPLTELKVRYTAGERRLTLRRGQAYFDVAHAPERPFRVTAVDRVVTALGTRFQITVAGDRTDVILIDGSVSVAPVGEGEREATHVLVPGQRLVGPPETGRLQQADIETETAWRSGRLVFRDEPLSRVVATFNRYSADRLVLRDAQAGAVRISGSFRYEGANDFATALEQSFPLEVARSDDGSVLIGTETVEPPG